MAFKFVIISCLMTLVRAGTIPGAVVAGPAPVVAAARLEQFDAVPQYSFGYSVFDTITGDIKSQNEQRIGNYVKGEYSLNEPDGSRRIVTYFADDDRGFNAVVRNEPQTVLAEPAVVAEPTAAVVAEPAVVPARIAAAAPVVPSTRYVAAPEPVFALRYTAPYTAPLGQYAAYQPVARFTATAPFAYPGTAAQVVAV